MERNSVHLGRAGGQEASMLALYSDDPSSNPVNANSFFLKLVFENAENKQKQAGVGP